jgi:hypothetical protein
MKAEIALGIIVILLATLFTGCLPADKEINTVYVSHDPTACKSIVVDCSQYAHRSSMAPFSNENGCGCTGMYEI